MNGSFCLPQLPCRPYFAGLKVTTQKPRRWHRPRRTRCVLVPEGEQQSLPQDEEKPSNGLELRATNESLRTDMTELDKALAVAEEAATAAGVDPNLVKDEVRAAMELGSKEEQMSWEDRLTALLEDISEFPEYWVNAGAAVSGIALASVVASAMLSAVATVPALAQSFEMIGLIYVFWFGNSYVLSPSRRAALAADVRAMLREARDTPNRLLSASNSRENLGLNGSEEDEDSDSNKSPY